jgi:hypothetical protein
MHYKLFLNVPFTTGWAGNSPGVFKEFYKRLVTKQEARDYWVMLPTWLKAKGAIEVELPRGHKLDSAITEEVKNAVAAAREAMAAFRQDVTAAAVVESRPSESEKVISHPIPTEIKHRAPSEPAVSELATATPLFQREGLEDRKLRYSATSEPESDKNE